MEDGSEDWRILAKVWESGLEENLGDVCIEGTIEAGTGVGIGKGEYLAEKLSEDRMTTGGGGGGG